VAYADDYDGGMFIMNCSYGSTKLSSDGKTWTMGGHMNGSYGSWVTWAKVDYGGGVFVMVDKGSSSFPPGEGFLWAGTCKKPQSLQNIRSCVVCGFIPGKKARRTNETDV
jgi:hypothetical protein